MSRSIVQGSASLFDEGRFGPVYRSHDPDSKQPVLIRTFAQPLTPAEQGRLVEALTRLCETPLDHSSIARPLVAGIEEGRPFLVHTLLPGVSLQRYLESHGAQPFADVVLRVTQLAAAVDFAAAAGVHHGDLGPRDVILDAETIGISGFGVMQALHEAGIGDRGIPSRADDVRALGRLAFELITGRSLDDPKDLRNLRVPGANGVRLRAALSGALGEGPEAHPTTALAFAAALQAAIADSMPKADRPRAAAAAAPLPVLRDAPALAISDLPLRPEHQALAHAGDVEPILSFHPEQTVPDPGPLLREQRPASAPDLAIRPAYPATLGIAAAHSPAREERAGGGWFLIAAALAIGILAGFTGGFVIGQRSDVPIPRFAADLLDGRLGSSPAPAQPSLDAARGTRGGEADTDAPASGIGPVPGVPDTGANVIERPEISSRPLGADRGGAPSASEPRAESPGAAAIAPPAPTAAAAEPTSDQPQRDSAVPRVSPDTPGGLQILSRPEGAQIFVDGALVGRTPLVIPSVTAGPHDVRLELDGHRNWGTLVRVQPGERARVAASLER